jgi:hypothetical protein
VKPKNLREDIMANAERQVAGVGPGATDQPFYQMAMPKPDEGHIKSGNINYPFEIARFKDEIFDIFEKTVTLRNEFERAKDNPSVTDSQKIALEKAVKRLDILNRKLIEIPDFLTIFSVEI